MAKQKNDNKTQEITSILTRQQRFRLKMKEQGFTQKNVWVSKESFMAGEAFAKGVDGDKNALIKELINSNDKSYMLGLINGFNLDNK